MIQTKITKDIYHGDGTTRRFEVTFDYNTKDNIKQIDLYTCTYTIEEGVTKYNNDVTKITSNYNFEVVNNVTYAVYPSDAAVSDGATPMATGTAIIIMRNTPNEQLSTGQYTSEKVEKQLDRITMVAQELQEQLNRAYQAPEYVDKVNKADFATVANDIDAVNTVAAITEDIDLVNANAENITTVAQNIEDVNATGQSIEDVNTVALNINDVSTVAGVSSDVTQVASISTAVSNVSDKSSDVTLVSDNMASVMTTASSITDVQTVASIATDVSAVADNNTNVTAVAGNATNINTVAGKISEVETVADNISDVNTVSTNISDVTNVSDNMTTISEVSENMDDVIAAADAVELVLPHITEINNVSDNINDIVTVAGINSDVSTVATNSSDISSVADNATNINTVATNISNVNTAANNMAAIIAAPTAATNAANSALNAATSATNAQKWAEGTDADVTPLGGTHSSKGWANRAQELVESIGTVMRYKGSVANYTALQAIQNPTLGDTYNVLDTGANYTWDGTAWDEIGSAVDLSAYRTSADQDLIDATKAPNTNKVNGIPLSTQNAYYYAESTSAADAVEKVVSIPAITELNAGQVIIVKPTVTSTVANSTLKLNSFNAYPMRYGGSNITTSTGSKVWSAHIPSIFVFDGSYWRFAGHGADDNTTYTLNYLIFAGTANAGVGNFAVTRYALLMQKLDGTWETLKETSTNYSTDTTKTVNTNGFIPGKITYYNATTVIKNGNAIPVRYLYLKSASLDARYSFNCGATPGWSAGDSIYVVGTIGSDGLFYLDSTTWWTNALPTTQDGKVYMYIGTYLSDAYKISLDLDHPMFYHDGTSVKHYVVAGNKQDKLVSGTNIKTVNGTSLLGSGDVSITASAAWGSITGTLSDQTDLQNQLDSKAPAILLSYFPSDHKVYNMSCLRGDTFSWQSGNVYTAAYGHLVDDLDGLQLYSVINDSNNDYTRDEANDGTGYYAWTYSGTTVYTSSDTPAASDTAYSDTSLTTTAFTIDSVSMTDAKTKTVDDITLTYYEAEDGHEIVLADQESNVMDIYNKYGISWYHILDTANTRFKLPRDAGKIHGALVKSGTKNNIDYRLYEDGWCEQRGQVITTANTSAWETINFPIEFADTNYTVSYNGRWTGVNTGDGYMYIQKDSETTTSIVLGKVGYGIRWMASGYAKNVPEITGNTERRNKYKYLYFYVGTFTNSAIQETAGLNSELFNDKLDRDFSNKPSNIQYVVETYHNGTSWYRIWSDGWCEQGGKFYNTNTAVSFLKAFSDTSYNLQITTSDPDPTDGIYSTCATNKTITGFTGWIQYGKGSGSNVETDWKAEGYIS